MSYLADEVIELRDTVERLTKENGALKGLYIAVSCGLPLEMHLRRVREVADVDESQPKEFQGNGKGSEMETAWAWFIDGGSNLEWPPKITRVDSDTTAERLAEFQYYHGDGLDRSWPLEITIISPHGETTYVVEREAVPQFSAARKS